MKLKIYQVDAFADKVFEGNPAAVCPLQHWLDDTLLLNIAAENNLSETAFYVIKNDCIEIRWFSPITEVELCGHATLASACVLINEGHFKGNSIPFFSIRSGFLPVTVNENNFTLIFPSDQPKEINTSDELMQATSVKPIAAYKGKTDILLVFEKQEDIEKLQPQHALIEKLDARGVIVTAKGKDCDFVSRFFAPKFGINEDPVTGSAHTTLTPYWANQLNKIELNAMQISARKGKLFCKLVNDTVEITGNAILYMKGEIEV